MSHVFISFFDSAVDIWALETAKENERGKIIGAMQAGIWISVGITTIVFSVIAQLYSFPAAFLLAGIIVLIIILIPLFITEEKKQPTQQHITPIIVQEFKKPLIQHISLFATLIIISSGLLTIGMPIYLRNVLLLNITQVGLMVAIIPAVMVPGTIVGGIMADNIGRKKTIYLFVSINLIFAILLILASNWWLVILIYGTAIFTGTAATSAYYAMYMDIINPKVGATQFSLLTSGFGGIGDVGGRMAAGILIAAIGFQNLFILAGLIFIPPLLLLRRINYTK